MTSSPTAVAMAWLFGVQSMHAYVQFGWLPQIYRDAGLSASTAGLLQALLSGVGVGGALLMPTVIARSRTLAPWMVAFGVLMVVGYAGLLLAPATAPWLWALSLGLAGWAFPTSIALLTARTRTSGVTARLSGFVQPVGYALAAIGPFLVGLLHDATGDWDLVLVLLALTAVPFTWAGLRAARPVWVDDELSA
jgi:CP family cyanate transporter-like MFS transporter